MKKILLVLVLVLGMAGAAWAETFTLDNFNATLNNTDPGLVLQSAPIQTTPFSFDLNVGGSTTFDLFKIWTDESDVGSDDRVEKEISVSLNFTAPPPPFGSSIDGDTVGVYNGRWYFNEQFGRVEWDGPVTFNFGPQGNGELTITLSNETFNWGLYGLSEGSRWGANVEATAYYATAAVPEPTTMLLLGLGLLGVAGIRRFKKQNKVLRTEYYKKAEPPKQALPFFSWNYGVTEF